MGVLKGPTKPMPGMDRHGQNSKNVQSSRRSKPNPTGAMTGPIKGRDKGTGGK